MKKKGSALLTVVIIMMITFFMAAIMVDISIKSKRLAVDTLSKTKAYYCAETGIYDFINYVNDNKASAAYITAGTKIVKNSVFGDSMALYNTNLMNPVSISNNSQTYTFSIYSKGTYSSQSCIVVATVSINYDINGNYLNYTILTKQVYKA